MMKTAEILKESRKSPERKILQERIQIEGGRHEPAALRGFFFKQRKGPGVFLASYLVPDAFDSFTRPGYF